MEIDNFLPGSASLVEMVDKKLLISLRDGRHFYGILRSYDQFGMFINHVFLGLVWPNEKYLCLIPSRHCNNEGISIFIHHFIVSLHHLMFMRSKSGIAIYS